MSKKNKQQQKMIKLNNAFQQPDQEIDVSSKYVREQLVLKFLEERDKNVKS